jgi:hypothetical protein
MTVATRSPGGRTIVLQGATNLGQWFDIWTNADAVGSHQLSLPLDACSRYFLRAVLP